jgi:hypothetical protein
VSSTRLSEKRRQTLRAMPGTWEEKERVGGDKGKAAAVVWPCVRALLTC